MRGQEKEKWHRSFRADARSWKKNFDKHESPGGERELSETLTVPKGRSCPSAPDGRANSRRQRNRAL